MENVNSVWEIIGAIVVGTVFFSLVVGFYFLVIKMAIEIRVDHTKSEAEQEKEREKYLEESLSQYPSPDYPYNQFMPPGSMV